MCEPTTLALVASGASAIIGAKGAYDQASVNKQIASNNSILADRAATDAIARGDKEAAAVRRQASLLQGRQRASFAARGLDLNEGTPADILDQTDFFSQSDQATARTNARREAQGFQQQGANFRAQADSINPGMQLTGSLLGSAGSVASKWYGFGDPTYNGTNDIAGVNGNNALDKWTRYGKGGD